MVLDDLEIKEIVAALWRNNSRPSAHMRRTLDGLRASAIRAIAEIDDGLLSAQSEVANQPLRNTTISSLLEARSRQEKLVNAYSAQLSSVRLLPPEVLVEIFRYTLPDRLDSSPRQFPLALRCVCSAWREAVLAYPSLWNGLLPLDRNMAEDDNTFIKYGFSRTPTGALSFWIFSPGYSHRINYHYIPTATVFRSISPFYHLLSELEIDVCSSHCALTFLSLPSGSVPLLEKIRLEMQDEQVGVDNTQPWTVFHDVPCLRRVQFTLPTSDRFRNQLVDVLPWNQFTHVAVSNPIDLAIFAKIIFRGGTGAQLHWHEASFCIDVYAEDTERHGIRDLCKSPVQLASLSELTLQAFSENKADAHEELLGEMMSKLDLPVLEKLDFVGLMYEFPLKMATVVPSPLRHLASLRSLVLADVYTTIPELTHLLSNYRTLAELSLCLDNLAPVPISPVSILRSLRRSHTAHACAEDQTTSMSQPPSHVAHNFPCLASFNFGFRCSTAEESKAVATEFSALLSTWLTDAHRETPLVEAGFYISNFEQKLGDLKPPPSHVAAFGVLSERLGKWIMMAQDDVGFDGALNLTTHVAADSRSVGVLFLGGVS
ncbi:hypothetical protein H0H81_012273 [Sphagnurus paluster]|uniref:F-box domain-containing protein n=1 Tax=Sphagnurus paluster TaxID=117069 RepID=A0A9P7FQM9_9AGAR|nr:hypothetical protein H0H81_012273 [Sphagnurus paluster]